MADTQSSYKNLISKPEFSFWTPIIFTAVSITISFMTLSSQVALQNQKLDQLIAAQGTLIEKYENVQARLGANEIAIGILQASR